MARRKAQIPDSLRWPRLFREPEQAVLLFQQTAWVKLVEDCRLKLEALTDRLHNVPLTEQDDRMQLVERGRISVLKDIVGLEQELKEFQEIKK